MAILRGTFPGWIFVLYHPANLENKLEKIKIKLNYDSLALAGRMEGFFSGNFGEKSLPPRFQDVILG